MHVTIGIRAGVLMGTVLAVAVSARADSDCVFVQHGQVMRLQNDCRTDQTLLVPDGVTLDGAGHTITAVDPPGGHFEGAVVQNAGASADVWRLGVTAQGLADVCDPSAPQDTRLRGIYLLGASGSVVQCRVHDLGQGASGCQEGNAIEVRGVAGTATPQVLVALNQVTRYQKTGILANGNVEVAVVLNRVQGLGPVGFIAQNGIQLGFGAQGWVKLNDVKDNVYTAGTASSAGILLQSAGDGVMVAANSVRDSDIGIGVVATTGASVTTNRMTGSTYAGLLLTADDDVALGNTAVNNTGYGLFIDGDAGRVSRNHAFGNDLLDIFNQGDNTYERNRCGTSSGPPVDCGDPASASPSIAPNAIRASASFRPPATSPAR